MGIAPAASVTGFGTVTMTGGTVHLNNTAAQNAQTALTTAYTTLSTLSATTVPAIDLGGRTLTPGVWRSGSTLAITGTLTLDGGGDPNALFVIQATSALTTAGRCPRQPS